MSTLRLVRVVWEDASVADEGGPWIEKAGLKTPEPVMFDQVGWLMELTPQHVVLTSAVGKEHISQRDRIPTGMVRSITAYRQDEGETVPIPKKRRRACPQA